MILPYERWLGTMAGIVVHDSHSHGAVLLPALPSALFSSTNNAPSPTAAALQRANGNGSSLQRDDSTVWQ